MSGKINWKTLEHSGPLFPEEYTPLPENVMLVYEGKQLKLNSTDTNNQFNISVEEAAVLYSQILEREKRNTGQKKKTKSCVTPLFSSNFWDDWKSILNKHHPQITNFEKVDFSNIVRYVSEFKIFIDEERGMLLPEEKKSLKNEKEQLKEDYGYAVIDGEPTALGNFRIQPPGLYIGHTSKSTGRIKGRIKSSDVIVNGTTVHGNWGARETNPNVGYIAKYKHPVTRKYVYIQLDRKTSKFVEESDQLKFDKARKLGENIGLIRKVYQEDCKGFSVKLQQLGVAVFLLDTIAIRPGTEKDETADNDTIGLTTLKVENVKLLENSTIEINFFGKSSIEFKKNYRIPTLVHILLTSFSRGKATNDLLFDHINPAILNDYLKKIVPGITAKTFRTWKASSIFEKKLSELKIDVNSSETEKSIAFKNANIETALALNHKRMNQDNEEGIVELKNQIEKEELKLNGASASVKERTKNKIDQLKIKLVEKTENVSTITSKVNYIDPRIAVAWAKRIEFPIEKIYNQSHLLKFRWAVETRSDWKFK